MGGRAAARNIANFNEGTVRASRAVRKQDKSEFADAQRSAGFSGLLHDQDQAAAHSSHWFHAHPNETNVATFSQHIIPFKSLLPNRRRDNSNYSGGPRPPAPACQKAP